MKKHNQQMKFSIVMDSEQVSVFSTALDLSTLEAQRWEAANILRGQVDPTEFKSYILPRLLPTRR